MLRWKVKKYIDEHQLCRKSDRLIVGVSGGADSVALLRLLLQMGYAVEAAHCNFQLRGEESERDEQFVRDVCRQNGAILHVKRFDTTAYAAKEKVSIEMAARELRYAWFRDLLQERQATAIAVAHHREDNAETVLLNLIRGTGITGLCGMRPKNGPVIRPLLDVSRAEIEDYLHHLQQGFVIDSTNLEDHCTRNKIRLNILPGMQTINPSVVASIVETASRLTDAKRLIDVQLDEAEQRCKLRLDTALEAPERTLPDGEQPMEGCKINIHQLQFEVSPRLLLYRLLSAYGFNSTQIEEIHVSLTGEAGRLFESPKGWTLLKDRNFLIIRRSAVQIKEPGERVLLADWTTANGPLKVEWGPLTFRIDCFLKTKEFIIPHQKNCACFDADRLPNELYIRHWQRGDRFTPFGMKGTKLLSDYMTDCKFSLFQKEGQAVLVDKDDRIIWLVGERIDDRYRVDSTTKSIVLIQITD